MLYTYRTQSNFFDLLRFGHCEIFHKNFNMKFFENLSMLSNEMQKNKSDYFFRIGTLTALQKALFEIFILLWSQFIGIYINCQKFTTMESPLFIRQYFWKLKELRVTIWFLSQSIWDTHMVLRSRQSETVGLGGGALLYGMTLLLNWVSRFGPSIFDRPGMRS